MSWARVHLTLSTSEFERNGMTAALASLHPVAEAARRSGDHELTALVLSQRAMIQARSGNFHRAIDSLDAAVADLGAMSPGDQSIVMLNRGMLHLETGQIAAARHDLARSMQIAQEHSLARQQFMATHNLGLAAHLAGDLPAALDIMMTADRIDTDVSRAPAWHDRAKALLDAGLIDEAAVLLEQALTLAGQQRQWQVYGEIEVDLARALVLQGRIGPARSHARRARARFARRGAQVWAARAELVDITSVLSTDRAPGRLANRATAVAAAATESGDLPLAVSAWTVAAEAHIRRRDPATATAILEGLDAAPRTVSAILHDRYLRTWVADDTGDRAAALRHTKEAARALTKAQAASSSLDVRTAIALHGVHLAGHDLRMALKTSPAALLAAMERWRAATARLPQVTASDTAALDDLHARLRWVREAIRQGDRSPDTTASEHELQGQIRARGWVTRAGETSTRRDITLRQLVQVCRERETDAVTFATIDGSIVGLGVVSGRVVLRHVGSATEVQSLVRGVLADLHAATSFRVPALADAVIASLKHSVARLDDALLRPFSVGQRRLVVVGPRALAMVPWLMLPSRVGQPTLVGRSLTTWAAGAREVSREGLEVVAVAGPDLGAVTDELASVVGAWPGGRAVGADTSRAQDLKSALRDAELVHVAAHGTHNAQSPLFSSVRLHDGPFAVHEMQDTGVRSGHVVLAACDVGRETVRPGDEALGLAAGLLALGATCVVASVGPVPDDVAAATMTAYHRRLAAGYDIAEALAHATEGEQLSRGFVASGAPWRVLP